jgi:outer membrane lipoprotein-sorting protein
MNARLDENLDKAYESFTQHHDALRDALMASLPESATQEKRSGVVLRLRRFTGGLTMNSKITRIAIAAAVVIAALIGFHYLGGSPIAPAVAWAEVLENVEAARTIVYRQEFEKAGEKEIATVRIMEPYLRRSDIIEGTGRYNVAILDTLKCKCITFYAKTRTAVIGKEDGSSFQIRTYENLKKDLRDGTEKDLGPVKLNGRDTVCFEISREHGKTTVWADPNTALPIQIETISDENGRTRTLMSDIGFDIELDEQLFKPPADYCVLDLETQRLTTPFELTEEHLIEGLAVYPKYLDGRFPTRYMGGRPRTDEVREKCRADVKRIENWSEEESHRSTLGCAFIEQLPEGSEYQYVGEDVRLGDTSKAVCWWKPPGSKTSRVVYGDLSIRDVAPDHLPPIPWLVEQK